MLGSKSKKSWRMNRPVRRSPPVIALSAPDVHKFCGSDLQDTMRVLACLQANRPKISAACNRVLVSHGQ
jgi:hypothetical protein